MLHHSSSAVALEMCWSSATALDYHISSAAWRLIIIFQVPRGTWSSYFKCHGAWWMMQHYYVLYTYMVNTNQQFLNTLRQSVQKILNTLPQLNTKGQKGPKLEPLSRTYVYSLRIIDVWIIIVIIVVHIMHAMSPEPLVSAWIKPALSPSFA